MSNFNKVVLMGRLTTDPEVRYTPKGTAVTDLNMAINRVTNSEGGARQQEVTFLDVTLWGRQADIAGEYLSKGRPVLIEGRLQMDTWEDKQTGKKRSKLKVIGENMQLLGRSSGDDESNRPAPVSASFNNSPSLDEEEEADDIPF